MDNGYNPRTVEEVFRDFKGRRTGVIKALTTGFRRLLLCFVFLRFFFSSSFRRFSSGMMVILVACFSFRVFVDFLIS